jgi:hypothetical protein
LDLDRRDDSLRHCHRSPDQSASSSSAAALAEKTAGDWDDDRDSGIAAPGPVLGFLIGVRVSAVYWPLQPGTVDFISKLTARPCALVTSAWPALRFRLVSSLGTRVQISGLMRNVCQAHDITIGPRGA